MSQCMSLVVPVFLCCAGVALAVPANDDFAAMVEVGSSGQVMIDNSGATLEAGEPIPSGFSAATYQATSWWYFSPSISDGWFEFTTVGSTVDTVLAIWTGNDITSLTLVHVNDEAVEGGVSRIRFFATVGETYVISVASKGAARGTVILNSSVSPTPFARVTSASFAPVAPDAGPGAVNVSLTVNVEGSKEVTSGLFTLFSPTGGIVTTVPFAGTTHRTSGNVVVGIYTIPLVVPANSVAGAYKWSFRMETTVVPVPSLSYGWEAQTPFPSGTAKVLNVANSGPPDGYSLWVTQNSLVGPNALKNADPDQDGVKNVLEYASGLVPNVPSRDEVLTAGAVITRRGLPQIGAVGTGDLRRLRVEFVRRLDDLSITYTVRFSDNLVDWEDAAQAATVVATDGSTYEVVAVEDVVAVPAKTRRYAILQVTR